MSTALTGGTVIDCSRRDISDLGRIIIDDVGVIERLDRGMMRKRDTDAAVDLEGLYVTPGLIDAHTHLGWMNLAGEMSVAEMAAEIFTNARLALEAGYTTIRDLGGIDGGVASLVASGRISGPRILPSGPIIRQLGGHGDMSQRFSEHHHAPAIPGLSSFSMECTGPAEVRRAARWAFKHGATQLKLCISGGVVSRSDEVSDIQLSMDECAAAVDEAAHRGTYVTAHAHNAAAINMGLDAGIRCFEHATYLDEGTAARLAETGARIVPTLSVGQLARSKFSEWEISPELLTRFEGTDAASRDSLEIAAQAGVAIGLGSDLLGVGQENRGLEVYLRSEAQDPMTALAAATSVNADVLGIGHKVGAIELGKYGDIIAFDVNPLQRPDVMTDAAHVVFVMKGGQIVKDSDRRCVTCDE